MRAIDADELKGRVNRIIEVNHLDENAIRFTPDWVKMFIEDAPTIEPERKKGRWLPEYGDVNAKAHYCNACNFYYTTSPEKMNYCPYCGAKMEKMPPLKVRSSKQTVIERWQNRIGEDES